MDGPSSPGAEGRPVIARLEPGDAVQRPVGLLDEMVAGRPPVVSWSVVTRPALVLGRTGREVPVDAGFLATRGITTAHRRSGGQPVLWDAGLLSLDVVLPPGHRLAGTDVTAAYEWLGRAVADGLGDAGVPARVVPIAEARAHAARQDAQAVAARRACFGGLSPFEVVAADGRKLVGLAQARRRTGTLYQCGILMRWDPATLAAALERDPGDRAALESALGDSTTDVATVAPGASREDVAVAVDARVRTALSRAPEGPAR